MIQTTTQRCLNSHALRRDVNIVSTAIKKCEAHLLSGTLPGFWPSAVLQEPLELRCCRCRINYYTANAKSDEVGKWLDLEMWTPMS